MLNSPGLVSGATILVLGTAPPQRRSLEEAEDQGSTDGEGVTIFSYVEQPQKQHFVIKSQSKLANTNISLGKWAREKEEFQICDLFPGIGLLSSDYEFKI